MSQSQPMRVLTSRATTEWYTPPHIIELARAVLGEIDLDPASHRIPQEWIRANTFWTNEPVLINPLNRGWFGKVWLNPPFDDSAAWCRKLEEEYHAGQVKEALLLVNSNLGYKWFEQLWRAWPCCCLTERISFINESGKQFGQSKRGQTILYFGENIERFAEVFSPHGRILLP